MHFAACLASFLSYCGTQILATPNGLTVSFFVVWVRTHQIALGTICTVRTVEKSMHNFRRERNFPLIYDNIALIGALHESQRPNFLLQ